MENHLIDQIRSANDIVEVIQAYLPLKHVGSNWRGICPFHQDTTPSLYVSQPKQIFKCFACGKAGNVLTFVQDYEKLSFIEAVKKLAARVGIPIPEYERTTKVDTKRDQLLLIYKTARDFFAENLFRHGAQVLKYLENRQISAETAKNLELGYALNGDKALLNHLMKEGHSVSLLKESGLFGNYSGNLVDMFRDRLMFPIHNNTGDVIAFGGRVLDANAPGGKYVNSPGTELYTKGKELYGLFKTKYEISKADSVLVCEGYFDFLRLYGSGFVNSVASLGTALTEDQIYLLNRYTKKIYMLYDGDTAGIRNAVRAGSICLGKGLEPFVVELPPKEDPDSFLLQHGSDALKEKIATAKSLIGFVAYHPGIAGGPSERIDLLLDPIRVNPDAVRRELLVKEVSEAFGISAAALNSRLRKVSRAPVTPEPQSPTPQHTGLEERPEERFLLILSLQDRDNYKELASQVSEDYFSNRLYRDIFRWLMDHINPEAVEDPSSILNNIDNAQIRDALAELLFEDLHDLRFGDTLNQVRIRKLQRDLEEIDRKILAEPQNVELFKQKQELSRAYRRMTSKVVHKIRF